MTMEGKLHQVTPFGHPRVLARLQLSEAFRSLLRPSSPVGTKAFTISPSVPHIEESPGDPQLKSFRVRISLFVCLILVCLSLVLEIVFSHKIGWSCIRSHCCSQMLLLSFATRMSICRAAAHRLFRLACDRREGAYG